MPEVAVTHRNLMIQGTFPSEMEGGSLLSLRYSAWSLLWFGFVYWVEGVSEEI